MIKNNNLIINSIMKKIILSLFTIALIFSSCNETTTKKAADPNQEFDVVILKWPGNGPRNQFRRYSKCRS